MALEILDGEIKQESEGKFHRIVETSEFAAAGMCYMQRKSDCLRGANCIPSRMWPSLLQPNIFECEGGRLALEASNRL
jgi:hypothetical protein